VPFRRAGLRLRALVCMPLAFGVLLLPASAQAAPVLDQQQTLMDTNTELAVGGGSDQKLAQVVTSGVAGLLTEVRVPISCDSAASLTLQINDADTGPGGTNLAVSTFPGSLFPPFGGPPDFRLVSLGTPPFIPAETPFAFILSASGSCGLIPGPIGESYTRGNAYFDARPNPPGWVCLCAFANTANDLAFQTLVDPVCRVPNVVGQTRTAAELELRRYGCTAGSVETRFAPAPAGTVVNQDPAADTQLPNGSGVKLVVSLGPRPCIVPRVVGKTLRRARSAIVRANCRVGQVKHSYSNRVGRGKVLAQKPRPGIRLRPKARVRLVISRGPR
jgi:PASTA domain